jgi:hypothetical protein
LIVDNRRETDLTLPRLDRESYWTVRTVQKSLARVGWDWVR